MKSIARRATTVLAAGLLLAGCQSHPHRWADEVQSTIEASVAPSQTANLPAEVSQALVPRLRSRCRMAGPCRSSRASTSP